MALVARFFAKLGEGSRFSSGLRSTLGAADRKRKLKVEFKCLATSMPRLVVGFFLDE
jgi:hypothetical protein